MPLETIATAAASSASSSRGTPSDANRLDQSLPRSRRSRFRRLQWLLFGGCWAAYGATLLLGALPWRSEPGYVISRLLYLVCTLVCGGPVWFFCRWVWRHRWSWPKAMLATAAFCYPLGCVSTLCSNWLANPWQSKPEPLSDILLSAFSASSPYCALVVCGGLYFGLKQYERSARVEALAREAQMRTLRHQLTPHFLCNTLNGISTLVGEGHTQEARRMIARLGDFLRTTLEGVGSLDVSVAQEISYVEQYLAIEQARLGERLKVEFSVAPDTLKASVPNLILQPLVENAIKHGIVPFTEGGSVAIRVEHQKDQLCFTVCNHRHRARRPDDARSLQVPREEPNGLGLQNTAERLRVAYGTAGRLDCRQDDNDSWTASITMPYHPWTSETGRATLD